MLSRPREADVVSRPGFASVAEFRIAAAAKASVNDFRGIVKTTGRCGMNIVVLGATGGTGRELVGHALERGHHVTAFVRSADPLRQFQDVITVRKGNALDA